MQSKVSLGSSLFIASMIGVGFSSIIIFFLTFDISDIGFYMKSVLSTESKTGENVIDGKSVEPRVFSEKVTPGLPIRLKISRIDVDAVVKYVGITSQGAMDVPKSPVDVAWFNLGPRPGEMGSAVISGHYGWKNNMPAVFDDLYKLQKGDKLYIEDEKGVTATFVVRELRRYSDDEEAPSVFRSSDGKAHLNLITCEGVWNKTKKSYSNRLVVFTDKE